MLQAVTTMWQTTRLVQTEAENKKYIRTKSPMTYRSRADVGLSLVITMREVVVESNDLYTRDPF